MQSVLLPKLTSAQMYVFDSFFALFGKDVEAKILVMATFADWNVPILLSALKDANIRYRDALKFNNCGLYLPNRSNNDADLDEDESIALHQLYWKMGAKAFDVLCNKLKGLPAKSMKLTCEVLKDGECLSCYASTYNCWNWFYKNTNTRERCINKLHARGLDIRDN